MTNPIISSAAPGRSEDALGGRIPLLEPDNLSHAQSKLYKMMRRDIAPWASKSGFRADTEDERMIGPFNPMLLSPEISQASLEYLKAEQEKTTLSKRAREIVILTTGAAFDSAYELYAHRAVAKTVGLEQDVVDAIAAGKAPANPLPPDEQIAYELTRALTTPPHKADALLYGRAATALGPQGIMDLIHLSGIYMMVSTLLNAFEVPVPAAAK